MKKIILLIFILLFIQNISFAELSLVNSTPSEPFEKRVNNIKNEVIKNPDNKNLSDRYVIALMTRADYYKKSKKNYERAADDLRSALYFLSQDKNSEKYQMASKKLAENLTAMEYYPTNAERLELAKNLYWEGQYFASAYELEQLAAIGYDEKTCYEFLGDIYLKINKEEKAVQDYILSYKAYPKNASVSYKLANLYDKNREYPLADEKYKETILNTTDKNVLNEIIIKYETKLKNNNNVSLYEVLALAYKKRGDYKKSFGLLNTAVSISPEDITLKYELGNILYEMGEYQLAINTYNSILSNNQYDSQIRIAYAKSLSMLGKKDDAIKEYQMVLVMYPSSHQAQYGIYRILYGLPLDKITEKFYPLNPNYIPDAQLYENLGDFAKSINELNHAKNFYKQALLKNSKMPHSYIALYNIYELENNNNDALLTIQEGYKKLPSSKEIIEVYENINKDDTTRKKDIALSYVKNNEYRNAITIYEQINPKNSDVYISMASCYAMLNEHQKSLENLQNAVKIDPVNSDLYYMMAISYLNQKSPESAKRELRKSIALDKKNLKSQKLLNSILRNEINAILANAESYYNKKDYNKALEIINAGIKKLGAQVQLLYFRGVIYYEEKKYLEALSDFKRVTEIDNSYDPVYYSLGLLFEEIGQERDALNAYERYLSGDPDNKANIKKAQERVLELGKKYY